MKHLGSKHDMMDLCFESQRKSKKTLFNPKSKKILHKVAINAIISDGLPFGIFRKPGVAKLLNELRPGYVGPYRKTVRNNLKKKYFRNRSALKNYFVITRLYWVIEMSLGAFCGYAAWYRTEIVK